MTVPTEWIRAGSDEGGQWDVEVEQYMDRPSDDSCGDDEHCVWACCECGGLLYTCGCCGHTQDERTEEFATKHRHMDSEHVRYVRWDRRGEGEHGSE